MDNYYASGDIEITSLEELTAASSASGGQNDAMSGDNGLWKMANKALIGKFNYDYKGRYLAEFSFRYDGSSKYTPYIRGAQWGFFPYAAIGWRISEEPFMKNSGSLSFIDNLKLRASAGQTGNDGTATFQFLEGYTYPGGFMNWPYYFDGLPRETMDLKPTVNNALTWEVMTMYDVGIDVDMWRGRLGVEFDLFRRDRSGIPATRTGTIPDWLGQSLAQENIDSQYHQGFDVTVRHRNRIGSSFTYGVTANLSYSRTKDKVVTRTQDDNQYSNWRNNTNNRYTDIWWGVDSPGQFSSLEQIWGHAIYTGPSKTGNAALKPGDYIYEDWNEDGVIDDKDTHPLRKGRLSTTNGIPMLIYGMTLEAQFKGFDFTMVFQGGAFSSIMYNYTLQAPFISDQNGPDFFYDRWHMADPKADPLDPRTKWISGFLPTTSQGSEAMNMNAKTSDSSLHRSDYLRCKSLEIGYSLPSAITNWIGIKGVRVYFSAYNLFTITSLAYLDPEHPNSTFGLLYPLTRTINFGANIKF